ncbi:MAG: SEC-C domain-containing protein [Bacteroidales bacterium]|nr:SEC-C domain-containing protein [Bacteroidales bacterium]
MKEALAKIDKRALVIMADHFDVEAPQSLPKEAIAEKLSSAILATAPEWLKRLPPYDIEILRELSKLPTGTRIEKPLLYFPMPSVMYNIIQIDDEKSIEDKTNAYYLTDDVHAAISACISEVFDNDLMREYLCLQQYGYGLLTLYGIISVEHFCDEIEYFPFSSEDVIDELILMLGKSELFYMCSTQLEENKDEVVLVSPWVENANKVWHEIQKRENIPYKVFEYEKIMAAGQLPYPSFSNEFTKGMIDLLNYTGDTMEDSRPIEPAEQMLTDIWFCIQEGESPMAGVEAMLADFPSKHRKMTNEVVGLYSNYQNSLPRWDLKGHSPTEVFEMGIKLPEKKEEKSGTFIESNGTPIVNIGSKIGRNDPCPCGSGKKYKNCCGKN